MKALRLSVCAVGLLAVALLAGGAPERDIYVTVALEGEPPPSDTVSARGIAVMPPNVAPGQETVPAISLSLTRRSSYCNQPLYLTGLAFTVASLDGGAIDPYDVISQVEVKIGGRSVPSSGTLARGGGPRPPGQEDLAPASGVNAAGAPPGDTEAAPSLDVLLSEPAPIPSTEDLTVEILVDIALGRPARAFPMLLDATQIPLSHARCSSPISALRLGDRTGPVIARTTIIPRTLSGSFSNYPNPFAAGKEATAFTYFLPRAADVDLRVYSGFGRLVKTLESGEHRGGGRVYDDIRWNGADERGATLQSGTYFAVLIVRYDDGAAEKAVRKVAVLR